MQGEELFRTEIEQKIVLRAICVSSLWSTEAIKLCQLHK